MSDLSYLVAKQKQDKVDYYKNQEELQTRRRIKAELEEIKAEIGKQYDIVEKDNLYCAEGLEMAYNILDDYINKADCNNDCEHCEEIDNE